MADQPMTPERLEDIQWYFELRPRITHAEMTRVYELISEVERLREQLAWRPIDTAPKDGSHVLLAPAMERGYWRRLTFPDGSGNPMSDIVQEGWFNQDNRQLPRSTHWMPLPEPPA